jgi:hypothetical protein
MFSIFIPKTQGASSSLESSLNTAYLPNTCFQPHYPTSLLSFASQIKQFFSEKEQ